MALCFDLLFGLLSYIAVVCIATTISNTGQQICWDSKWFNDTTTFANGSKLLRPLTQNLCTVGPVIGAQCKDDKGEPFNGTVNNTANHFVLICDHVNGLYCHLDSQQFTNVSCPDLSIQLGCKCQPVGGRTENTVNIPGTTTIGKHPSVTKSSLGKGNITSGVTATRNYVNGSHVTQPTGKRFAAGARKHKCKNNGLQIELNGIMLVLCTLLLKVL